LIASFSFLKPEGKHLDDLFRKEQPLVKQSEGDRTTKPKLEAKRLKEKDAWVRLLSC